MKKLIVLLFILEMLMIVSCRNHEADIRQPIITDTQQAIIDETDAEIIEPRILYGWHWTNDSYTYINGDATPWIGDEEEYRAFLHSFKELLPESFIKYDQLSELGRFGAMVLLSYDGSKYTYEFNDDDPQYDQYDYGVYNIYIKITHLSDEDSHNLKDDDGDVRIDIYHENGELDDLTVSPYDNSKRHVVYYNDIRYMYDDQGELWYMDMIIDDYRIHFSRGNQKIGKEYIDCYFKDYAPAEPNFITLLLEGAEYEEVAESFRQMIATKAE
ncbi:MAG: hypothetical protein IJW90_05055 [Clostridia bacterium]|nr:hypothetical protein [Clostridia bacterium]